MSFKRQPQTGKRASEIFTFVLLRGDSVEILLDQDLEKFQKQRSSNSCLGKLKHDLNSCESFQTFVQRHLKRKIQNPLSPNDKRFTEGNLID